MFKWLARLNEAPKLEDRVLPRPINPLILGAGLAYVGSELSGSEADLGDMAVFVAYPFMIAAAATAGAEAGAKALEARVSG